MYDCFFFRRRFREEQEKRRREEKRYREEKERWVVWRRDKKRYIGVLKSTELVVWLGSCGNLKKLTKISLTIESGEMDKKKRN